MWKLAAWYQLGNERIYSKQRMKDNENGEMYTEESENNQ